MAGVHGTIYDERISDMADFECPNHILLIGFSGAGKSTIARKLARRYGKVSFDTDIGIVRMVGKRVEDIFAEEGEAAFRKYEHDYLEYLATMDPAIISCGGGIITTAENREMVKKLGFVVLLRVDPDEAVSRITRLDKKPLLNGEKTPSELLAERWDWYESCADLIFDTSGKGTGKVSYELGCLLEDKGLL